MIESRRKNQRAATDAIIEYMEKHPDELHRELELIRFTKFLATKLVPRVQEEDCYFIDMLEDLERLED